MHQGTWNPTEAERKLHQTEEVRLSTDYSDRRAWIKMLRVQMEQGGSRLQGPPGLRVRMQRLFTNISTQRLIQQARTECARKASRADRFKNDGTFDGVSATRNVETWC
jgi:hypothetical protein